MKAIVERLCSRISPIKPQKDKINVAGALQFAARRNHLARLHIVVATSKISPVSVGAYLITLATGASHDLD